MFPADIVQLLRIRRGRTAYYKHQVRFRCDLSGFLLPFLSRIAYSISDNSIVTHVLYFFNNIFKFFVIERCLSNNAYPMILRKFQRFKGFKIFHHEDRSRTPPGNPPHFRMPGIAEDDDRLSLPGMLLRDPVDLLYERTRGIDHPEA